MFTLRNDRKIARNSLFIYLGVTVFCAIFGIVYEFFSHGKLSYYMVLGFLWPLIGGVFFYLLNYLFNRKYLLSIWASNFYNASIATLTVGCYFNGALEIYGTTRVIYSILYNVFGYTLLCFAILTYIYGIILLNREKEKN